MRKSVVACCISVLLVACAHQKKIAYVFPDRMSLADREKFTGICNKGQILYAINCGNCHTLTVNGRRMIPDFTQDQISKYDLKVNNMQHDSSGVMRKVAPEELSDIYLFLTYKKKSGVSLPNTGH